jgi:hypothetical protein
MTKTPPMRELRIESSFTVVPLILGPPIKSSKISGLSRVIKAQLSVCRK